MTFFCPSILISLNSSSYPGFLPFLVSWLPYKFLALKAKTNA